MVKRILHYSLFLICPVFFSISSVQAQCPAGYTGTQANWDNLEYYYNSGVNIAPYGYSGSNYVTNAQEQTQRFALGPNSFSIVTSAAGIVKGENTTHTGNIAGYTGADAQFTPTANGQTIIITFANPVRNVNFALYGIDFSGVINVTAADILATPLTVLAVAQVPTILTITGAVGKTLTANATNLPNTDNRGTATITVAGTVLNPVKTITLTCTTIGGNAPFWLSDINACVTGSFPTNWHQGFNTRPFTGATQNQPDYILVTPDNNSVYMMDPATAKVWFLFTDASKTYINSMALDPNNKFLYYISENSSLDRTNKSLKKYDFNTQTISVVLADISATLGLATFNAGVESAAASFYNGQLYIGIEGGQFSTGNSRESLVWRIDFNGANNPVYACQVFSTPSYDASGLIKHDWADFIVKDSLLISYNSAKNGSSPTYDYTNSSYTHYNMHTGITTVYNNPSPLLKYSGQAAYNWAGTNYMIYDSLWQYNNGVISGKLKPQLVSVPGAPAPPAWVGNAGDAAEGFRPKCDLGDAPATYDPDPISPAVHERSELIRLGVTWDNEWAKRGLTGNNDVDDGLGYVPVMPPVSGAYLAQVSVFNNIGANATLCAWLDYNGNGVFDASEGLTPITVPSSGVSQNFYLYWPSYTTPLTNGSYTYLRIRITAASAGMTNAHPTGYFINGEVEDYRVLVDNYPLSAINLSFDVKLVNSRYATLNWSINQDNNFDGYEIERSRDSRNWEKIGLMAGNGIPGEKHYEFIDNAPFDGTTYYRLKFIGVSGNDKYSEVKTVKKMSPGDKVTIWPNPVSVIANIGIEATEKTIAQIRLTDVNGKQLHAHNYPVMPGSNTIQIPVQDTWPEGVYLVRIVMNGEMVDKKLIRKK